MYTTIEEFFMKIMKGCPVYKNFKHSINLTLYHHMAVTFEEGICMIVVPH